MDPNRILEYKKMGHTHTQVGGGESCDDKEEISIYKPRRGVLEETNFVDTLISAFQSHSITEKINLNGLSHPVFGTFFTVAWASHQASADVVLLQAFCYILLVNICTISTGNTPETDFCMEYVLYSKHKHCPSSTKAIIYANTCLHLALASPSPQPSLLSALGLALD